MLLKQNQPRRVIVSLTPLIDVVFILLIFFMLASNFVDWQFIEFSLGKTEQISIDHENTSIIVLKPGNDHYLNDEKMEPNEIVSILKERCRLNADHPIIIQPHENVPLQSLITLMDEINLFASENISLARTTP